MKKKISIIIILILLVITGIFIAEQVNAPTTEPISEIPPAPISYPGDFSCQPNECEDQIQTGVNGISYPGCNSSVQINETGASNPKACDYWRTQQKYFGEEIYVDLTTLSRQSKAERGDAIVDGYLGMEDEILVHKNAADIFLKAEKNFNDKYGSDREDSTYFLPSYPNGYTFEFSGSLNKRGIRGSVASTEDRMLYEGEYILPSNHFWGVAIDFNSSTNYGNRQSPGACQINIPPEIVYVFESTGLRWGGRYFNDGDLKNYMDPMHFEYLPECIIPSLQ